MLPTTILFSGNSNVTFSHNNGNLGGAFYLENGLSVLFTENSLLIRQLMVEPSYMHFTKV